MTSDQSPPALNSPKISISLPKELLACIDRQLRPTESRSGYFQELAAADLEAKGLLTTPNTRGALVEEAIKAARLLDHTDEEIAAHISKLTRSHAATA